VSSRARCPACRFACWSWDFAEPAGLSNEGLDSLKCLSYPGRVCIAGHGRFACRVFALVGIAALALASQSEARRSGSATYTAQVFMRGMKVTVPSARWRVYEDMPGEFNLVAPPGGDKATHIRFFLDPIPAAPTGVALPNVGRTPAALVAWLRQNPNLVVSARTKRRVGHGLRATSLRLDVSADAPREDPTCVTPCVTYFVFHGPDYDFPYRTASGFPLRLYFATLHRGTKTHTFLISVEPSSAAALMTILPVAERILRSVRLPLKITTG
jgi:hypothetical protein